MRAKKVEGRKPQAKKSRGENRKQKSRGGAAKTASKTANTWSRGTQNGQTIGQWLKTLKKLVKS